MLTKLAVLYAVMTNYVVKLNKSHALILLNLIKDTNLGELLIQVSNQLRGVSDEWETVFMIVSRENSMHVLVVVDKKERFKLALDLLQRINEILKGSNIGLELGTMDSFTKSEWIPF